MAGKVHALLPHVADDEITSRNPNSSDSEQPDIEVDVIRVPAPPVVDGEVRVYESLKLMS